MQKVVFFLTIFFLFGIYTKSHAKHIIGGEFTYKCLGPKNANTKELAFTMRVYRDCRDQSAALFDENASVALYVKRVTGVFQIVDTFAVPKGVVQAVLPPDNPCLILPPNICVEKTEYVFNYKLSLDPSIESYIFAYQRCCRNNTITNLDRPGDQGATFMIEITKDALLECNNSPTFKQFPPTVICVNEDINFDHSATDSDGDQLVYEFCSPLLGGGLDGSNGSTTSAASCTGVAPNPACPPPYQPVNYLLPFYNALVPMGGNPVISINPNTGLISGVPLLQGQFVVGVCVKEYRNGKLLSVVQRDFQFNVANCQPTVNAAIQAKNVIGDSVFVVNSCGDSIVNIINLSTQDQFISTTEWKFIVDKDTIALNTKNARVTLPKFGTYYGNLLLNKGLSCRDSAKIVLNYFPPINADFSFKYDTCIASPVQFNDLSKSGAGPITKWTWNFADGKTDSIQNPSHLYKIPGKFNVALTVEDKNQCEDTKIKELTYYPVPPILIVEPSSFIGCLPATILFNNLSKPIDESYTLEWDFGDGGKADKISPSHQYLQPGTYNVSLNVTSPIGCKTSKKFNSFVEIRPSPEAGFIYTPTEINFLEPTVYFTDQSKNAIDLTWRLDTTKAFSIKVRNPTYTYPDSGKFVVMQIAIHQSGCRDTAFATIDIIPKITYFLPNAFTPNGDKYNEIYKGTGVLRGITDFTFSIWNRWGEEVFLTNDPDEGWNGTYKNVGSPVPEGVYACAVSFLAPRGIKHTYKMFVTLIR